LIYIVSQCNGLFKIKQGGVRLTEKFAAITLTAGHLTSLLRSRVTNSPLSVVSCLSVVWKIFFI